MKDLEHAVERLLEYKATYPRDLKAASDPVGPRNNHWLRQLASETSLVVAAWGNDGAFRDRASKVKTLLPNMHYLKMNKSGQPAHPLYLCSTEVPKAMVF